MGHPLPQGKGLGVRVDLNFQGPCIFPLAPSQNSSHRPDVQPVPLEAKNPFVLRVDLGRHVPETDVRTALTTGEMGFVHSFTTGSTVDGPGVRVVIWLTGCQFRCLYCHNPDTW